jgi:methylamine---glutamate N-methyltransferase subunit C
MAVIGAFCVSVNKEICINARMPGKCATCAEVCPHGVYGLDPYQREMQVQNFNACVGCRICSNSARPMPSASTRRAEYISRYPWTLSAVEEVHYKAQTGEYLLRGFGTARADPQLRHDHGRAQPDLQRRTAGQIPGGMRYGGGDRGGHLRKTGALESALRVGGDVLRCAEQRGQDGPGHRGSQAASPPTPAKAAWCRKKPGWRAATPTKSMKRKKWEPGGYLIIQWSTGRWGVSVDYLNSGDAVEVKIGQGAKPGMGGHLLGAKVTEDVSRVRGVPVGSDALSPCRYYDVQPWTI